MPMSTRTIPGTQDQYGRGRAAVRICGQAGTRTNAGRAITPFMFNEEEYRVSFLEPIVTHWEQRGCYPGGKLRVF